MAENRVMNFLLDTNVISELARPQPSQAVVSWLDHTLEATVFISVVTLAELHHGVEKMPSGYNRSRLHSWLATALPDRFEGRILPVDVVVAQRWGIIVAQCEKQGMPIEPMDALLAATAIVHHLTLATRNIRHFPMLEKAIINPWTA
jgi:predicted nucleic acid-binding protein